MNDDQKIFTGNNARPTEPPPAPQPPPSKVAVYNQEGIFVEFEDAIAVLRDNGALVVSQAALRKVTLFNAQAWSSCEVVTP